MNLVINILKCHGQANTVHLLLKIFLKNGESYTAGVRNFKSYYKLSRHNCVKSPRSIMLCVNSFRGTGSALESFGKLSKSPTTMHHIPKAPYTGCNF